MSPGRCSRKRERLRRTGNLTIECPADRVHRVEHTLALGGAERLQEIDDGVTSAPVERRKGTAAGGGEPEARMAAVVRVGLRG